MLRSGGKTVLASERGPVNDARAENPVIELFRQNYGWRGICLDIGHDFLCQKAEKAKRYHYLHFVTYFTKNKYGISLEVKTKVNSAL
ncbi:MAG: hypothetical protein AB1649_08745 [Chloroflexota bacterium]